MSLSEQEFFRMLPLALAPHPYTIEMRKIFVETDDGKACISISPQAPRHIASLSLPVLAVDIDFGTLSKAAAMAFVKRFDQAFQRGGG